MLLKLRNSSEVPPGGFRVTDRGNEFRAPSLAQLTAKVAEFRRANNYPIGALFDEEVEDMVCRQLNERGHPQVSVSREIGVKPKMIRMTWQDVIRGTSALWDAFKHRSTRVSQDEADRRAAICIQCPFNENLNCSTCGRNTIRKVAAAISGAGRTKFDSQLRHCRFCKCSLAAAVWVDMEVHEKHTGTLMEKAPDECWKKKGSINYRG